MLKNCHQSKREGAGFMEQRDHVTLETDLTTLSVRSHISAASAMVARGEAREAAALMHALLREPPVERELLRDALLALAEAEYAQDRDDACLAALEHV
jgi:hypothetical protein